ncbi:MAG: GNAT family N-acetyltransferase [Paracoccaceae bacterium]
MRDTAALVGLILLFKNTEKSEALTVQLGYFLFEPNWGKGYATEMVTELIAAIKGGLQTRLVAGVDRDNVASVGVLEKSGFKKIPEKTTAGRYYFEIDVM